MTERHVLSVRADSDGTTVLLAPSVGIFASHVGVDALVGSGQIVGTIEVLGLQTALVVPDGIQGRIVERVGGNRTRVPVQYRDVLIRISTAEVAVADPGESASAAQSGSLSFDAPMSGRFYSRPSPNDPAFVSSGATVARGQTIGLLEVMKTFNRLVYQGDDLPPSAVVERVVPADGDDVVRGDPILFLSTSDG